MLPERPDMKDFETPGTRDKSAQGLIDILLLPAALIVGVALAVAGIWLFGLAFAGLLDLFAADLSKGLTPSHLLGIALTATAASTWVWNGLEKQSRRDPEAMAAALGKTLLELLVMLAITSLVASAMLAIVRHGLTPGAEVNVRELELQLRRVARWLELLPHFYLLAAVAFVGAALAGWSALALRAMGMATKLAAGLGALKTFLSVLLLVSLLATGVQSGAQGATARMLERKEDLSRLKLTLHAALRDEVKRSVSHDIQQQMRTEPQLAQELASWDAFARLRAHHPRLLDAAFKRGARDRGEISSYKTTIQPARLETLDRLSREQLERLKIEIDPLGDERRVPAHKPAADMIVKNALDETLAEKLRSEVLEIQHPALELLASTFLNPLMVASLRGEVERRTQAMLESLDQGLTLAQLRERLAPSARLWASNTLVSTVQALSRARRLRLPPPATAAAPAPQPSLWDGLRARLLAEHVRRWQPASEQPSQLIDAGIVGRETGEQLDELVRTQHDLAELRRRPDAPAGTWDEAEFKAYLDERLPMRLIWASAIDLSERSERPSTSEDALSARVERGLRKYYGQAPTTDVKGLLREAKAATRTPQAAADSSVKPIPVKPARGL